MGQELLQFLFELAHVSTKTEAVAAIAMEMLIRCSRWIVINQAAAQLLRVILAQSHLFRLSPLLDPTSTFPADVPV